MSAANEIHDHSSIALGKTTRIILSCLLCSWLFLVLLGPLSNPIASTHLTGPLAQRLRPWHQVFFLGHGYRFFGPDPGPSHLLQYRIQMGDNQEDVTGRFPDRDVDWPRLLYHRWFMLSETVHQECANLPTREEHNQLMREMQQEIERLRLEGELPTMNLMAGERENLARSLQAARVRSRKLLSSIARYLLEQHGGQSIELSLMERLIARPVDIQSRVKLSDARFLSRPRLLASFSREELQSPSKDDPGSDAK